MKKKILCMVLCFIVSTGFLYSAIAAATSSNESTMIQIIGAMGIMTGDEGGNLRLDSNVTRAEFAKMLVAASPYKDKVAAVANSSPFLDVSYTHWAAGYIKTAVAQGWLTGYLDGTYHPEQNITLEEAVSGVLKLMGYGTSDFSGSYPYGQLALYESLSLNKGVSATKGTTMNRHNMLYLFYNLLNADSKEGTKYVETLGYKTDSNGDIDFLDLMSDTLKGPFVIQNSISELGINTAGATIYRNGVASSSNAASQYDVVYYSTDLNTIWIFSNSVTGFCQSILDSQANPASVVVAGSTYTLGTTEAKLQFSTLGSLKTGDMVTLLLGQDGSVVSAMSASDYTSSASAMGIYGVVTKVSNDTYTDASGNNYTEYTLTISATDGQQYVVPVEQTSTSRKAGSLVKVIFNGEKTQVSAMPTSGLDGKFNSDATKLGNRELASDVEILDVYGTNAVRIYPSRLAGATIYKDDMLYYTSNEQGQINRIILNDYTGDVHQYGILTGFSYSKDDNGKVTSAQYNYDIAGQSLSYSSSKSLDIPTGPIQIKLDNNSVDEMNSLTKINLDAIVGSSATSGSSTYALSDSVVVYELRNGNYYYSSLGAITSGDYSFTGYYDELPSNGGRIRVIVAKANES